MVGSLDADDQCAETGTTDIEEEPCESGGRSGSPEVTGSPTLVNDFKLLQGGGDVGGTAEVEITVGYTNRHDSHVRGTLRFEGVRDDDDDRDTWFSEYANGRVPREILPFSPKQDRARFYIRVVETDWLRDDDLGFAYFDSETGGKKLDLAKNLRQTRLVKGTRK